MPIQVHCTSCAASYQLLDEAAGKRVRCKKCGKVFAVPDSSAVPVVPPLNLSDAIAAERAADGKLAAAPEPVPIAPPLPAVTASRPSLPPRHRAPRRSRPPLISPFLIWLLALMALAGVALVIEPVFFVLVAVTLLLVLGAVVCFVLGSLGTLGDATGQGASGVARLLVPAYGLAAGPTMDAQTAERKLGFIFKPMALAFIAVLLVIAVRARLFGGLAIPEEREKPPTSAAPPGLRTR